MKNHRQDLEAELFAMLFAIAATFIFACGLTWAIVFALRWLVVA